QDSVIFGQDTLFSFDSLYWGPPEIAPALTYDIFILKTDPNGNTISLFGGGWFGSEDFMEVEYDEAGNMLFSGWWRRHNDFAIDSTGLGYDEAFLLLMDTAKQNSYTLIQEDTIRRKKESFTHKAIAMGRFFDRGEALATIGDSMYLMGGIFQDTCYFRDSTLYKITNFEDDVFISAYDDSLHYRWVVQGSGPGKDDLDALVADAQGNIYAGGRFDTSFSMGGINLTSQGNLDGYVAKLDMQGNVLWVRSMGGPRFDAVKDIELKSNGNLVVTGYFQGEMTFGNTTISGSDSLDQQVFIMELDPNGDMVWLNQGGGISLDAGAAIDVDANGYTYVLGTYNQSANFGQANLTSQGSDDIFLIRMAPDGAVSAEGPQSPEEVTGLAAFPNPASQEITLRFSLDKAADVKIQLRDIQGKVVKQLVTDRRYVPGTHHLRVSLDELRSGMYFYSVEARGYTATGKFVVTQ
ncbi:MAG: T9SS type A sorting domain-containing protein, partial [Bacteroidota bacterium]